MSDFTLKALFKRAGGQYGGDSIERLIVDATCGLGKEGECHVETWMLGSPPQFFSALAATGVRIADSLVGPAARWYALDTGLIIPDGVRQWAVDEIGQRYDTWDAFRAGFEGVAEKEIRPLFCSMAFVRLYELCGGPLIDHQLGLLGYDDPNPHKLAGLLLAHGAKPCEVPLGCFTETAA
jgi:hypothetical protein